MQNTVSNRYRKYSIIGKPGTWQEQVKVGILGIMKLISGTNDISSNLLKERLSNEYFRGFQLMIGNVYLKWSNY